MSLTCSRQPALSPWQPELANDCSKVQAAQREVTSLSFPLQSQLLSCSRSWGGWWWWGAVRLWGRGAVCQSQPSRSSVQGRQSCSLLSVRGRVCTWQHGNTQSHRHIHTYTLPFTQTHTPLDVTAVSSCPRLSPPGPQGPSSLYSSSHCVCVSQTARHAPVSRTANACLCDDNSLTVSGGRIPHTHTHPHLVLS